MSNDRRRRPPDDPEFDLDLAGPAAWGEETPRPARKRPRPAARAAKSRRPEPEEEPSDRPDRPRRASRKRPRPQSGGGRSRLRGLVIGLFWLAVSLGLAGLVLLFAVYAYFSQDLPSTAGLKEYAPPTVTYFYSDDGRVIGEYSHERRIVVPLSDIPPHVRNAFIAVEDAAFYQHKGVNPKAIIRAALANLESGEKSQGGSTITQQVVKSFLLTPERSYVRKIKEMILAFRVEGNLTKDEILYLYLNQIYLGRGAYGVEAAARTYFDKPAKNLSIAEAAMLAGITQSPSRNPVSDPKQARERQNHGIKRMDEVHFITPAEAEAARAEVLNVHGEWDNPNTAVAPYFAEHVRRIMEDKVGAESLYNDGWRVFTTVNIEAQRDADAAVAKGLWEYARRRGWKGPDRHLDLEEQITDFLAQTDKELPEAGLDEDRLYQAVVMAVDAKNSALSVRVGPYSGRIVKKNLAWALKKNVAEQFRRGDVVWVRVLGGAGEGGEAAAPASLSALVAGDAGSEVLDMSLERRTDVQSALLSMDLENGDIKAMVGGRDFGESQFNRAIQSQRQPGSSFKPILYAAAMGQGYTPGSIMNDAPFVVDDPGSGKRWKPVNSDLKFKGPMSLYTALVGSRNLISVKLLDRIGYEPLEQTAAALGIKEKLPRSLTVALGAHGLHLPELVTAYSAFPNMGTRVEPRYITRIEDRYGRVVETFEPQRIPALDPGSACAVTWMLRGVVEQGTGTKVKPLGRPVGGKTGTTNDFSDAWFIGFTPELVTAVWVGTDQQRPKAVGEVGGNVAGPIFLYYMRDVLKGRPVRDFTVPPEAELAPGGAFGICYKAGTVGTGISEVITGAGADETFLREDFESTEEMPTPAEDQGGFFDRVFGDRPADRQSAPPAGPGQSGSVSTGQGAYGGGYVDAPSDDAPPPPQPVAPAAPAPRPAASAPAPQPQPAPAAQPAPVTPPVAPMPQPAPVVQPTPSASGGSSYGYGGAAGQPLPRYGDEGGGGGALAVYGDDQPRTGGGTLPAYGGEVYDDRAFDEDGYLRNYEN